MTATTVHDTAQQRRDRAGRAGWTWSTIIVAALVVVPVAMLAASVIRPSTDVWRQQWRTRLPGQIADTVIRRLQEQER